ncbi:MAG TPA: GntR family transcriptional regulator [Syntrophorhabdaceae bacterium]|jgi:DNA-binding FadR family transcriptional regulator
MGRDTMPETPFQQFETKRFSEQVAQMIQRKIIKDEIKIGSRLPGERQLADDLKVSRSVLREALRLLEATGYVDVKKGPKGGIFVSNVFHKPISVLWKNLAENGDITIDHIFDVRMQFEPFVMAEATRNATGDDIQRLRDLYIDVEDHFQDPVYLKNRNFEFHVIVAGITRNPILSTFTKSLLEILAETAFNFLDLEFEQELSRIHRETIELMARGKTAAVKNLFKKDMLYLKETLRKTMEREAEKL